MTNPLGAYQISKRWKSLRVMAEAGSWGKRAARVNTISPGITVASSRTTVELLEPRPYPFKVMFLRDLLDIAAQRIRKRGLAGLHEQCVRGDPRFERK